MELSVQSTTGGNSAYERKWFRRSPYELSIRGRIGTFAVLALLCFAFFAIRGKQDPFGTGFLLALLLINPVDWIIQGWRESAAQENR